MNNRLRKEIKEILRRKGVKPDCKNRASVASRRVLTRGEQKLLKSVAETTAQLFAEVVPREGMVVNERQCAHRHRASKMRVNRQVRVQEWRICLSIEGCRSLPPRKRHYGAQ